MKKGLGYCAVLLLAGGLVACNNQKENRESKADGKTDAASESRDDGQSDSDIWGKSQKSCAAFAGEKEGQICVSNDKESWSVYCYDGDYYKDYSENCSDRQMSCANREFADGTFGVCICTTDSQCTTDIANAQPKCLADGTCHFACNQNFHEKLGSSGYLCEEDFELPAEVENYCADKEDGYYCIELTAEETEWQIYCDKKAVAQGYSMDCTAADMKCGTREENNKTYNVCIPDKECVLDTDCPEFEIDGARTYCNQTYFTCAWECAEGYDDNDDFTGCVKL